MIEVLFKVVINDAVEIVRDWPWDRIVKVKDQLKKLGFRWTGEYWKGRVLSFSAILKLRDLLDLRPSEIKRILETSLTHNEGGAVGVEVEDPSLLPDSVRECIIDTVDKVHIISVPCFVRNFVRKDTKYLGSVSSFEEYVDVALQEFRKLVDKFSIVGNLDLALERAREFVLESPRTRELYERRVSWWLALLHENYVELNFLKKGLLRELRESLKIKYNKVDPEGNLQEVLIPAIKRENVIRTADGKWRIYFPQFFKQKVADILRNLGYVVKEVEYRPRQVHNIVDKVNLLPFQEKALSKWLENNCRGTIVIPTGGGKTFIALKAMAKLKVRTLILVITEELLEQWHERIHKYLGYWAGRLSGKYDELREITVCTYHTAVKRIDELRDYFDLVIADECLVRGTVVVLEDGGLKNIEHVENCDRVLAGGQVSNADLYRKVVDAIYVVHTDFGPIRTTMTHPHIVAEIVNDQVRLCVKQARDVKPGDFLLVPRLLPHTCRYVIPDDVVKVLAYLSCLGENSGSVITIERKDRELVQLLSRLGIHHVVRNGKVYVKKSAVLRLLDNLGVPVNCDDKLTHDVPSFVPYLSLGNIRVFLHKCVELIGLSGGRQVELSHPAETLLKKLQLLFLKFGIFSRLRYQDGGCLRLILDEEALEKLWHGKHALLAETDGGLGKVSIGGLDFTLVPVRKVEILEGKFEVYDFTTETHLFVADGYLTHNCHHVPAETFKEVMLNMSAPYRMALSATVERSDGNEHLIYLACGELVYRITYRELIRYGLVVPIRHYRIYVDLTEEEREEYEKAKNVLQLKSIAGKASAKIDVACRIAEFEHELGSKILIFTQYVNQAEEIYRRLREHIRQVALITGETRERDLVLRQFAKGNIRIVVATTVLDEGVDVPDADVAIVVSGTGSSRQMIQRIGRVVRASPGKTEARVYEIIARRTIEEALSENRHPKEEIEEIECVKVLAKDLERLLRRIRNRLVMSSGRVST